MADKKISALTAATTPLAGTEVLPIVQSGSTVKVSISNVTAGRDVVANSYQVGTRLKINATHIADAAAPTGNNTGLAFSSRIYPCDSAGNLTNNTLSLGSSLYQFSSIHTGDNLVVGTAGKGIDFSANGGDVLSQYDEGSWTVKLFDAAGGGNQSATTVTGYYTRVGNLVHCAFWGLNNISTAGMTAGNILHIELPFTSSATGSGTGSFASENITFNGRDNATPAVPTGTNRAVLRAYGSATSSVSVLVSNVGANANIDYFSLTYRV